MNRIKLVGVLTIIAGILGVLSPISLGGWVALTPQSTGLIILQAIFPYIGLVLSITGLVLGIATLARKKWTWKGIFVVQIVLLPLLTATVVSHLTVGWWFNSNFFPINIVLVFAAAITLVVLLVRPKTRAEFQMANGRNDS